MRLNLDVITIRADCRGRADIDALRAARNTRAAMGAEGLLVDKIFRLFELTGHRDELPGGLRPRGRIAAWREISLRRLLCRHQRPLAKIQHKIVTSGPRAILTREIDGAYFTASFDAQSMRLALIRIDLIVVIDRLFRTRLDTGIATRADFEIDCIRLLPGDDERAEIARQLHIVARIDWIAALGGQLRDCAAMRD